MRRSSRTSRRRQKKTRRRRNRQSGGGQRSNLFQDAYAITLQKYPKRFANMTAAANREGVPLKAAEGVVITRNDINTLPPLGVGTTHFKDRTGAVFNLGVIGAFLAHRNLLQKIASEADASKVGTLICEDDVTFEPGFYDKLAALEGEIKEKANDWDILFLDKQLNTIQGSKVSEHLMLLEKDMTGFKNWGIWAYIVKNASIKEKILPTMEHMLDVPDIQLAKFADRIRMYLVTPSLMHGDPETSTKSVVSELDTGAVASPA